MFAFASKLRCKFSSFVFSIFFVGCIFCLGGGVLLGSGLLYGFSSVSAMLFGVTAPFVCGFLFVGFLGLLNITRFSGDVPKVFSGFLLIFISYVGIETLLWLISGGVA